MKNRGGIPWFVFENRGCGKKPVSVIRERRAIVMAICFMTLAGSLLALSAAYCRILFGILVAIGFIIGFLCAARFIFEYVRAE